MSVNCCALPELRILVVVVVVVAVVVAAAAAAFLFPLNLAVEVVSVCPL
jgi:hypothetical protein